MIMKLIKRDKYIILEVKKENKEIEKSDEIKVEKEVEYEGISNIGVIKKMELMEEGKDESDIIEKKLLKLRRG
jgi:hypothetical protein